MKPVLEKIYNREDASFKVMSFETKTFDHPYHYHPEYELTLITEGSGHRFVGDHTDTFVSNDLVLLGKNLPHCWLDFGQHKNLVSAVVIQFRDDCFGKDFFDLPEMHKIQLLLKRASKGIQFLKSDPSLFRALRDISQQSGPDQLITFLSIMNKLSATNDFQLLSNSEYNMVQTDTKFNRIDRVFEYVSTHYRSPIDLTATAELVHMTPSAFCHYFKKYTKKTFTQYVNEVRIGYACKLLMESDLNVSQVCYQSGYNSLSRFNKCFKKITKKTPLHYRKHFSLPESRVNVQRAVQPDAVNHDNAGHGKWETSNWKQP
jgi:AraC-like DNA-binding protein